ncbi:MAG: hypothetical protein KAI47_10135 [Deltaproteobacteria bacterium]|nr:hypothetical protein [Deltaproteobacteria bacterium]
MTEFIVRLVIVFGAVFGAAYGITHAVKTSRGARRANEVAEAKEKIAALQRSLEDKELSVEEYDQLSRAVYREYQDKGIDLDNL